MFRITATALLFTSFAFAQTTIVPQAKWAFDELTLSNGGKFHGLILDESPLGVRFMTIRREPGRPTITLTSYFTKAEVGSLKRLSEADRKLLKERISELDQTGIGERKRMEAVKLDEVDWQGQKNRAKRYEADHFVLISSAPEEVTRRAAVRMEQIFTAFERLLPPRHEMGMPTKVLLTGDLEQYKELLMKRGISLLNPAVFDTSTNQILCGTDLRRLGEELTKTRFHHLQQLAMADSTEKDLRELYKANKPELERYLALVNKERAKIAAADRENDRIFDQATRRVFAMLYHEAFHSYTMNYVFPKRNRDEIQAEKGTGELPVWLNEGMAQLFEKPLVEAGELRVETPDPERLKRVQDWMTARDRGAKPENVLIPLKDLLTCGKETFLAMHANQQAISDRNYLTSWALAYYLTFDRRVFGGKAMDKYLIALNTGTNAEKAFGELVGKDLATFEKEWLSYLARLKADGTLKPEK